MSTLHTHVDAWIRMGAPVIRGRSFPFGEFSCTPLTPGGPEQDNQPVGFILSRGTEVTWVDPQTAGGQSRLWDSLVEEMHHWNPTDQTNYQELPPECWYG